ncbi:MAG TPA: DUF1707 domain-containing protein [Propionibacteriaceae bacterium]|nr:DUF1707 domain-containing protein [Propionibacteriaceae bacterium]
MNDDALRASDADRDQVTELLHAAYAQGRITDEEHTERLLAALRAKTFGELRPLTADLLPQAPSIAGAGVPVATSGEPDRMTSVLTEVKRHGPWRVRRRSYATVFLGGLRLDLTQATFEAPVVEINITQVVGGVTLRVPIGTTIRDETTAVLGDTSIRGIGPANPACPTIVLKGTNILGDIKVRGPKRSLMRRAT